MPSISKLKCVKCIRVLGFSAQRPGSWGLPNYEVLEACQVIIAVVKQAYQEVRFSMVTVLLYFVHLLPTVLYSSYATKFPLRAAC